MREATQSVQMPDDADGQTAAGAAPGSGAQGDPWRDSRHDTRHDPRSDGGRDSWAAAHDAAREGLMARRRSDGGGKRRGPPGSGAGRGWADGAGDDPSRDEQVGDEDVGDGRIGDDAIGEAAPRQTLIRPWAELLERTIEREVLPRLLRSHDHAEADRPGASSAEVERFVTWLIEGATDPARQMADALVARGADREMLIETLLTPAARLLGVMWEQDRCDFATVTVATVRLGEILRETAAKAPALSLLRDHGRSLLLAPVPGEQHDFGVSVLADSFGRAGWAVRAEKRTTRVELVRLVRSDWFDLLGLSVSAERWLAGLPAIIRTLRRAARNQALRIMVGGKAFVDHPERADFVGADAFAADAAEAVTLAGALVPERRPVH